MAAGALVRPSRRLNQATRFTIQASKPGSCAKLMGSGAVEDLARHSHLVLRVEGEGHEHNNRR